MRASGTMFGPSLGRPVRILVGLDEDGRHADRDRRAGQQRHEGALAAAGRPLAARLLHRVGGVEDDRPARVGEVAQRAHVGDERVVAERRAALGQQDPLRAERLELGATCAMSQGARNWPFLTLTARPVSAAAFKRSVWRLRKAGIWSTSTASAVGRHCQLSWTSVSTGTPRLSRTSARMASPRSRPDAAAARHGGAVRLVEGALEDQRDADAVAHGLELARHAEAVLPALDLAGAADEGEGEVLADA